jgi:CO/xanthine dehydrogenase FAD-binding subunit
VIAEAAAAIDAAIEPWDDLRATADIKRTMARTAAERAIRRAVGRAGATARDDEEVA